MFNKAFTRMALAATALTIPLAGASALALTTLAAGPANAAPTGITCSKLSGSVNTSTGRVNTKVLDCTGNTGGTGKSSEPLETSKATDNWANGTKTVFTETTTAGTGCPTGDLTEVLSGSVTKDTTGSTAKGAAVSATVCFNETTAKLSLKKGTDFTIAP